MRINNLLFPFPVTIENKLEVLMTSLFLGVAALSAAMVKAEKAESSPMGQADPALQAHNHLARKPRLG